MKKIFFLSFIFIIFLPNISLGYSTCPADLNGDGLVSQSDLNSLLLFLGTNCQGCPQDINGDGFVSQADLNIMLIQFGNTCPGPPPHIPVDITYIPPGGTPFSTSYEVGTTAGSFAVTQSGGAVYTIPLIAPPGTAGMVPNLSISYNSQSGEGLLGTGWNLSGLSSISRVGQTPYHDGEVKGVTLTNTDRFALDGNRLITNGVYGSNGTVYGTEVENFSRITSYGNAGGGPAYFIVETKDGSTLEYGLRGYSRIEPSGVAAGGVVLTWLLNKVTDSRGNYMNIFYYENNATGEFRPDYISYTGNLNTGLKTYNTVYFGYDIRQDKQTSYVAGRKVQQKVLLTQVQMHALGTKVHEYLFNYSYDMNSHLSEVVEKGSDGKQFNPTKSVWNTNDKTPVISGYSPGSMITDGVLSSSVLDVNGDGFSDIVLSADNFQWYTYTNQKNGSYSQTGTSIITNYENASGIQISKLQGQISADFDGDGLEDMIVMALSKNEKDFYLYFLKAAKVGNGYYLSANPSYVFTYHHDNDDRANFKYTLGDFDGDGATDVFIYFFDGDDGYIYSFKKTQNYHVWNGVDEGDINLNFTSADLNGDGKHEIFLNYTNPFGGTCGSTNTYSKFFEFNANTGTLNGIACDGYPSGYHRIYPGDFNGDGKTDLLTWSGAGWTIGYATGDGHSFVSAPAPVTDAGDPKLSAEHYYLVQDFNGDGKSDILTVSNLSGNTTTYFDIDYSTGNDFVAAQAFVNYPLRTDPILNKRDPFKYIGDFDGDGRMDLLVDLQYPGNNLLRYKISFMPDLDVHKVGGITDGLQNTVAIEYSTLPVLSTLPILPSLNKYTKGTGGTYPVNDFQKAMMVVNRTRNYSCYAEGIEGRMEYAYDGAKIHLQGKGFLGFTKVITTDVYREFFSENTYKTDMSSLNSNFFYPVLYTSKTTTLPPAPATPLPVSEKTFSQYNFIKGTNLALPDPATPGKRYYFYAAQIQDNDQLHGRITTHTVSQNKYGNVLSESSTNAAVTVSSSYTYEQKSAWIPSRLLSSSTTSTRAGGEPAYTRTVTFTNNGPGGLTSKKIEDVGVTTDYIYNTCGVPETTIVSASDIPVPITSIAQYDTKKRFVIKQTNAKGHIAETTYDAAYGNVLTEKDINGLVTSYTYDGFGRISTTTPPSPEPIITVTREWAIGSFCQMYLITTSQYNTPTTKQYYDKRSRAIRSEITGFDGSTIFSTKTYNYLGQLTQESEPNSTSLFTTYNYESDYKRLKKVTAPSGTTVEYAYGKNTLTSQHTSTVTTTAGPSVRTVTKTYDASDAILSSTDAGGTLSYLYHSSGNPRSITAPGAGAVTTMTYDALGRQITLTDPDAGLTTYDYDKLGRLIKQQTAKQAETNSTYSTTITYEELGRVKTKTDPQEGTITYTYDTKTNGKGKIGTITGFNGINYDYTYDAKSRLEGKTETIAGVNYTSNYEYDNWNRLKIETYPGSSSRFSTTMFYNTNGYLETIKKTSDNSLIWRCDGMNNRLQIIASTSGNGQEQLKTYSALGFLQNTHVKNSSTNSDVWKIGYTFEESTGNLMSRSDIMKGQSETFSYDNLDRLKNSYLNGSTPPTHSTTYLASGNINSKSDAGTDAYAYTGAGPHAVSSIAGSGEYIPPTTQTITYTPFNKVASIGEFEDGLDFFYGPDLERKKSVLTNWQNLTKTIIYSGNYEKITTPANTTYEVYYINTPDGLAAMNVRSSGTDAMKYVYTDHLGSIDIIFDQSKTNVYEQSFDAWGRERDPVNWANPNPVTSPDWLIRGYTGHEHHREFRLINMNGRMYDPQVGRMLSPDNYVQAAGSTQSYNRYSYVWNNPLKFTDPSGDLVFFIIPSASWSSGGGLDIGVSVGVGIPGVASAQLSVGYGFGSKNAYTSIGGTLAGVTASVGYGTQTGFTAGYGFGLGLGIPGLGTNLTSAGFSWSQNGGTSANMFGFQFSAAGAHFDPSFSISKAINFQKRTIPALTNNTDPDLYANVDGGPDANLANNKQFPPFSTLWENYPAPNEDGSPAHPGVPDYPNQCAIRMAKCLINSGVDMSSYPESNKTSNGYARSADNLANWIWKNYGSPKIMQSNVFEANHTNSTGIIYIEGVHIDLWNKGQTGSGFYNGKVMFWPVK